MKPIIKVQNLGKRYRLGDVVKVKVVRVDLDERKIDFMLSEDVIEAGIKAKEKAKKSLKGKSTGANPRRKRAGRSKKQQ